MDTQSNRRELLSSVCSLVEPRGRETATRVRNANFTGYSEYLCTEQVDDSCSSDNRSTTVT
jgi:hypothetical protein